MMTGIELIANPYSTQRRMPAQKVMNMPVEISFVDRVFQVFMTCGRKESVVIVPAVRPRSVTKSIRLYYHALEKDHGFPRHGID